MPIRVVIVDDHELLRAGMRAVLARHDDLEVVADAASSVAGLRAVQRHQPDVVIVHLRDRDSELHAVPAALRDGGERAVVVAVVGHANDEMLLAATEAKASAILLERTSGTELARSVRLVADGASLVDPAVAARLVDRLRSDAPRNGRPVSVGCLSPQERRLLDHVGDGLTNRQIAGRMNLAEKTVKNYMSNLLRKLDMNTRTEAAVYVTNVRAGRAG